MKFPLNFVAGLFLILGLTKAAAQQLIQAYGSKVMSTPYHAVTTDHEGNVFVYYHFDRVNGEYVGSLAKLDHKGQLIESFNRIYTDGVVGDVQVQQDGKIVISGSYTRVNDQSSKGLIRLNPDGSVDMSFSSAIQHVGTLELQR